MGFIVICDAGYNAVKDGRASTCAVITSCGDGTCSSGETSSSCPSDCGTDDGGGTSGDECTLFIEKGTPSGCEVNMGAIIMIIVAVMVMANLRKKDQQ